MDADVFVDLGAEPNQGSVQREHRNNIVAAGVGIWRACIRQFGREIPRRMFQEIKEENDGSTLTDTFDPAL
jgi:hypothetical protein